MTSMTHHDQRIYLQVMSIYFLTLVCSYITTCYSRAVVAATLLKAKQVRLS